MLFNYPLTIHNEDGYWGEFPDVPGCNCQGDTLDEIVMDARESLNLHLLSMVIDGETLPTPSNPTTIKVHSTDFVTMIYGELDIKKKDTAIKKTLTKVLQEALLEKVI